MWLADPVFLRKTPNIRAQFILLLMLSWVAVPLLLQLPFTVSVMFGFLLIIRMLLLFTTIKKLPVWGVVILLIGTGAWVYFKIGTFIGRDGGVSLLLLMVLLKAYEGETLRDWQVLLLAQIILMGGALLFNQGILMAPWLIISLFCLLSSLGLLAGIEPQSAIKQGIVVLLLSLPLAVILFIVAPRKNTPLWGIPPSQTASKTGLSNSMDPGSISNLVQSNDLAFNVIFDNNVMPKKENLYWRVVIMGRNQNGVWQAIKDYYTDEDTLELPNREVLARNSGSNYVSYQLVIKDDNGYVPALDQPLPDKQKDLSRKVGNVIRVDKIREGLRRIHLASSLSAQLQQNMDRDSLYFYLELPADINLQTRMLARKLAKQSQNTEDFIQRILSYYREQHFQYTLTPKRGADKENHTDYFLFNSHEGFCEDFADATVWLARAAGVPARVVTGYLGGEYHADGQFWQVRSKDAHAWTEIWVAEKNIWQRIDPTTAISEARVNTGIENALPATQTQAFKPKYPWLERKLDQGQFYWQQWVVNYDGSQQNSLISKIGFKNLPLWLLLIIIGILIIITALPLMIWVWRQGRSDISPLVEGFNLLKQSLIEGDTEEILAFGPEEIKTLLQEADLLNSQIAQLLDQYILWQYGSTKLPSKHEQRVWYRNVKRAIRKI